VPASTVCVPCTECVPAVTFDYPDSCPGGGSTDRQCTECTICEDAFDAERCVALCSCDLCRAGWSTESNTYCPGCSAEQVVGVANGLRAQEDPAQFDPRAVYSMYSMAASGESAAVTHAGGIPVVVSAMNSVHAGHQTKLYGMLALGKLAQHSARTRESLLSAGGIEATIAAMGSAPTTHDFQHWGCNVLHLIVQDSGIAREKVFESGGIDTIVEAMHAFPEDWHVQRNGCSVLGRMAVHSIATRATVVSAGGVTAINEAIQAFPDDRFCDSARASLDPCILEGTDDDVRGISCRDARESIFFHDQAQIIEGSVLAMQTSEDEHIQELGCYALLYLATSGESSRASIVEAGGVGAAIELMQMSPTEYTWPSAIEPDLASMSQQSLQYTCTLAQDVLPNMCSGVADCTGHGACMGGVCFCEDAYDGSRCEKDRTCRTPPLSPECTEPHPATMCALSACKADDDRALMALPYAREALHSLSFPYCFGCECIATHNMCSELRNAPQPNLRLPGLDMACGCSCGAQIPLEVRTCVAAALPEPDAQPMWTDRHPSEFKTPAEEYNVTQLVCDAGLDVLVERTAEWLDLATDYQMQTAEDKAGVIAHQVCVEQRFSEMKCFGAFENQTIDAQTLLALKSDLSQLHQQACVMAENIANGYSIDNMLSSTDVGSLSFHIYTETLQNLIVSLGRKKQEIDGLDLQTGLNDLIAAGYGGDTANAEDEGNIWQQKANAAEERREAYKDQIQDISQAIDGLMAKMGVQSNALIQAANDEMWRVQESLQCALDAENPRPRVTACDYVIDAAKAATGRTCPHTGGPPRPICDESDRLMFSPPLQPSSCATSPPLANGCDFSMAGIQVALQTAAGTDFGELSNLDDLDACCEEHALCYSQCGTTQLFCDQEMRYCMRARFTSSIHAVSAARVLDKSTGAVVKSLAHQRSSCSRFVEAQELSVFGGIDAQCRNADEHRGCISSCHQDRSCMDEAIHLCHTVAHVAGVVSSVSGRVSNRLGPVPLPGPAGVIQAGLSAVETAADVVKDVAEAAACALAVAEEVEAARDENPESQSSEELQRQFRDLNTKKEATKQMVGTVAELASLSTRLLTDPEIDPASIARIDMSFMKLDLLTDDALSRMLSAAIPADQLSAGDYSYEGDIPQLTILIRSKLDQTRAYYEATLDKRANEQQRDLLRRRADRALRLVNQTNHQSQRNFVDRSFLHAELRAGCHVAVQYLIQAVRAYEYYFLDDYPGRQELIDNVRSRYLDGIEYFDRVSTALDDLEDQFTRKLEDSNNCGSEVWSRTTFNLADLPAAKQRFVETGNIKLTIQMPNITQFWQVQFSDVQVYLLGFPDLLQESTASRHPNLAIRLGKAGTSDFLDAAGKVRRFTHDVTDPIIQFEYGTLDCRATRQLAGDRFGTCDGGTFISPSPYGTWEVQVPAGAVANTNPVLSTEQVYSRLSEVTAVRFQFKLKSLPLSDSTASDYLAQIDGGRPVYFTSSGDPPGGEGSLGYVYPGLDASSPSCR
jgi:hypothetical protein